MSAIALENVSYEYHVGTAYEQPALRNVDLKIADAEMIGIIGASGSGKSTLLQIISGLLAPSMGAVRLMETGSASKSGSGSPLRGLREYVGLVFQFPEHQLFEESVAKDVAFGVLNTGLNREEAEARIDWALSCMGLAPSVFRERSPFSLSGGEMRRVAIASVIAMRPRILVLDEPTAGLDPASKVELVELLLRLRREQGMGVVMASHSMEHVFASCERVIVLEDGAVLLDAPSEAIIREEERLCRAGLSLPRLPALLSRLRREGVIGVGLDDALNAEDLSAESVAAMLVDRLAAVEATGEGSSAHPEERLR